MKKKKTETTMCDVKNWVYSDTVREHFFHPQNFLIDEENYEADGVGVVGSPACGDMMAMWIKVDKNTQKISECKWKTFGCASAIASTSMLSVMVMENGSLRQLPLTHLAENLSLSGLGSHIMAGISHPRILAAYFS